MPIQDPVPAREQVKDFVCRCGCSTKFMDHEKEAIFKRFNEMGSYEEQNLFLQSLCVPTKPVARRRKRIQNGGKERNTTFTYHFEVDRGGDVDMINVCKQAFLNILGIPESRIRKKVLEHRENHGDGRGRHGNRPNRLPEDALEKVSGFYLFNIFFIFRDMH